MNFGQDPFKNKKVTGFYNKRPGFQLSTNKSFYKRLTEKMIELKRVYFDMLYLTVNFERDPSEIKKSSSIKKKSQPS